MKRILILTSLICSTAVAQVDVPAGQTTVPGDAELLEALDTLAFRFMFARPRHLVSATRYRANSFFAVLGATVLVALKFNHHRIAPHLDEKILSYVRPVKAFADRLGRRDAYGLAALVVFNEYMAGRKLDLGERESERFRASLAAGTHEYDANLVQFFSLSRAEQFMIARRDPEFARALVAYAELVRAESFRMEGRPAPPRWGSRQTTVPKAS